MSNQQCGNLRRVPCDAEGCVALTNESAYSTLAALVALVLAKTSAGITDPSCVVSGANESSA